MIVQLLIEGYSVYSWNEINDRGFGFGLASGYGFQLNPMRGNGSGLSFGFGDEVGSHFSYDSWYEGSGGSNRREYGINEEGKAYVYSEEPLCYVVEINE